MSNQQGKAFHINQLLPEVVEFAFPELNGVDIIAEFADTGNFFTEHYYESRLTYSVCVGSPNRCRRRSLYTLRLDNELKGAPEPVLAGAMAMELQQIAKIERSPLRYHLQRFWEKCSIGHQIKVSQREDIDMIRRGLGGNYAAFNNHITEHCGYVWNPLDGYSPPDFEMFAIAHQRLRGSLVLF